MIVVLGSLVAQDGKVDELLAISLQHVQRSRAEPGCISHNVSVDSENPRRLVFVEEWADRDALKVHFALSESRNFVKSAMALAASPPSMKIYEAEAARI